MSAEAVLQDFGLKNVGKEYRETPFCGGTLPSGWYLVIHGRHKFTNDEVRRLSHGCEVVACLSRSMSWSAELLVGRMESRFGPLRMMPSWAAGTWRSRVALLLASPPFATV